MSTTQCFISNYHFLHKKSKAQPLYNISLLSLKCEIGFPQPHIALVHAQSLLALHNKLHFLSCYSPCITCNSSCPLQVMTALFACGTWRVKPASRSSRLTGRSSRSRSTMWRFIRLNATLPAPGQTLSPKCLYDVELRLPLQPRSLTQPPMIGDQ